MSQTERLMAIIGRLCQRNGKLNTAWVSNTFEVTDRQARRDIGYIRDRIVDQYFGSSVELIYDRASNEYRLTGSQEEMEKQFARSVISSAVAASAVDPLKDLLGSPEKSFPELRSNKVKFISQASELPDYTIFTELLSAIDENRRVRIHYKNINKVDSVRTIEPLELINYSAIWYVRAYDLTREELRTFSLSRIRKADILNEKRGFNDFEMLKKSDASSYGIFFGDKIEKYTIRFYNLVAYIVSNQVWHRSQKGHWLDENTYELEIPASVPTELIAKTLSFGADAEPISPQSFVDSYNKELSRLFEKMKR